MKKDSEVQAQGKIPVWFAAEELAHWPAGINTEEVTKQGTSCSESIATDEGSHTTCADIHLDRRLPINSTRTLNLFEFAIPSRTQVYKLNKLQIPQEGIVDGAVEECCKDWQPEF